ncbi:hypothetical protein F53441_1870 [Fusarium austroafricanum]|uniref:RRM domain-containing protein n=1 Tax=Fusarium austroafricanum TaxID=2364996 RepID=A0A8H4NYG3_9HYPO|nr:hypothetical protein F53441_1870 [Fusarium austroafricanum]
MADKMDRGLDEIIADTRVNRPRNHRGQGRRREPRNDYPRDGVRKSVRDDSRNLDRSLQAKPFRPSRFLTEYSEWVHDRFEENNNRRAPARRHRESPDLESKGFKLRVENIHYDLTEEDLDVGGPHELFRRIGPVVRLQLRYDRAGRSEGTAYVTYELKEDAQEAVKQFDGANANGQPIRLTLLPSRNPFDTAVMPGRPLAERISSPGDRRSHSPHRRYDDDDAARRGIDRYIPGQGSRRSPMPRQRGQGRGQGGRRPGARRDVREGGRDQEGGRGGRGNPRTKKTQEELDAEMADYFGGDNAQTAEPAGQQQDAPSAQAQAPAQAQAAADIDMIE